MENPGEGCKKALENPGVGVIRDQNPGSFPEKGVIN
jgi:hypothetical protein